MNGIILEDNIMKKRKKKIKCQIEKHIYDSKWIPPEKRMTRYDDYGIVDKTPPDDPKWKKVKWIEFRIIVPDEYTKQQLQAACEYFHDNKLIDTDFLAVNSLAHSYVTPNMEPGVVDRILVDPVLFKRCKQETCSHNRVYNDEGVNYCEDCGKSLDITSYKD
jgi:hypothetical protein